MQSIAVGSQDTVFTGATPATALTAPASAKHRMAIGMRVTNLDTAAVTVIVKKDVNGTATEKFRRSGLASGGVWDDAITADKPMIFAPLESIEVELSGAPATNQPVVTVDYLEITD